MIKKIKYGQPSLKSKINSWHFCCQFYKTIYSYNMRCKHIYRYADMHLIHPSYKLLLLATCPECLFVPQWRMHHRSS